MYRQTFFEDRPDKLLHVIKALEYIRNAKRIKNPFAALSVVDTLLFYIQIFFVGLAEGCMRTPLYIENEWRELAAIHPKIRETLLRLLDKKVITSWNKPPIPPDQPRIAYYGVTLGPLVAPSGKIRILRGSAGSGVGADADEALTRALAEALERHSLSLWNPREIVHASFKEMKHKGAVDPRRFNFFSKNQTEGNLFSKSRVSDDRSIGWVRARSFVEGKRCFVPAQLVYIFYENEHAQEPLFWDTTTSGSAAGSSFEEAACRAICEAIERDAFLIFWLNTLAPPHIDLDSIDIPQAKKMVREIKRYGLELHLLDITTDMAVPTFAAVMIDHLGDIAVSVSLVTDFSVERSIEKLLYEIIKFLYFPTRMNFIADIEAKYPQLESMEERRILWSTQKMVPYINFLLKNEEKKSFALLRESFVPKTYAEKSASERLVFLRDLLRQKKYDCYLVDVTSPVARKEGITTVRAIIPQLVPMYFKEQQKYLGVQRLYDAPVVMGYRTKSLSEKTLNPIPHPFT